jgi:hypothetical protein
MISRIVCELKRMMRESGVRTALARLEGVGVCSLPALMQVVPSGAFIPLSKNEQFQPKAGTKVNDVSHYVKFELWRLLAI